MAKWQNDLMLDAAFGWLQDRVTGMSVCSQQPTTYTEAKTTYALAQTGLTSTDLTIADDTSGRKVTIGAQSGVSVDTTGTGNHVALFGSTGSTLLLITTCTTIALTTGGTVDFPAWKDNLQDAA